MAMEPSYNNHATLALFSCDVGKVMSPLEILNLNNLVENDERIEHMPIFKFKSNFRAMARATQFYTQAHVAGPHGM